MYWPGEVAEGDGTQQVIIGERADPAQREGLRKILHAESTAPGATHFFVYNSTMSTVLDTLYAPIELSIDVDQRMASLKIEELVESRGTRIIPLSGWDRVAPAAPGADKFGGNYAASLLAEAQAAENGCYEAVWVHVVERRYFEEMGGMNLLIVFGNGGSARLVTPELTGSPPGRYHAGFVAAVGH
jgi:hypothetical protein